MPKETVIDEQEFNGDSARGLRTEVRWGRDQEYVQIATVADDRPSTDGWYCSLDRKGINDLIKYLRKARDQAFGRDE